MTLTFDVTEDLFAFLCQYQRIHRLGSPDRAAKRIVAEQMFKSAPDGGLRMNSSQQAVATVLGLRGEVGTTYKELVADTGLSMITVRNAVSRLLSSNVITECGHRCLKGTTGYPSKLYRLVGGAVAPTELSIGAKHVLASGDDYSGTPFEAEIEAFFKAKREAAAPAFSSNSTKPAP